MNTGWSFGQALGIRLTNPASGGYDQDMPSTMRIGALHGGGLVEQTREEGFEPQGAYSGACDLCTHLRWFLFHARPSPELAPAGFYAEKSLPDFPHNP